MTSDPAPALSAEQIASFISDGFVRIDNAFSKETADKARSILWTATGCDPNDRSTWLWPVIRLGQFSQTPFREAANGSRLLTALDQLVGPARWWPCNTLGTFPIRFPPYDIQRYGRSVPESGGLHSSKPYDATVTDDGWHIDTSFGSEHPDFMEWRANVFSKGRALLMLFLFSDVGADDAPTRIRVGSHHEIARQLAPAGEAGLTLRELADRGFAETAHRGEMLATGEAGTIYLCHPFLVHAAQLHRGKEPRFLAQPPLFPRESISLRRSGGDYSPVEQAILNAIDEPNALNGSLQ